MQKLSKNVFLFLKEIKSNNNRDWFEINKLKYNKIKQEIVSFSSILLNELNKHDDIESSKIFRIYRDIRFSNDKTPYKTNIGISFKRSSIKLRGGYYVHIKPNESFVACGFFNPNKEDLYRIRKEFEFDAEEFRDIINKNSLKRSWGVIDGNPLKTNPRGFSKDDPNIDLIRMRRYLFIKKYNDKLVLSSNFINTISEDFRLMRPFLDYMSLVLSSDLNGVSLFENE